MIDLTALLKDTNAYGVVKGDLQSNRLSHAYLFLTPDGDNLTEYLKIFAKLIICKDGGCGKCRACRLIDENSFPDLAIFPKDGESVLVDDVNSLINDSYIKPIECDKKVFIISQAQTMNLPSQNKLLKTLEEPPKGVHILIGATSEFPLLATVKSRVKKLEIPPFSPEKLVSALKGEYTDLERLNNAVECGDGTVGKAVKLYSDDSLKDAIDLVVDMLINMKSSANVLDYSIKISQTDSELSSFLSVLELILRDMLVISQGKKELCVNKNAEYIMNNSTGFSTGAIINALEKVTESYERKKFNANPTMLVEWLLFQILEGKYKWQKL
ncbi:MAG: hypothetical protein IJV99_02600 [Clostridia bacterium]|nr:hypothetical protein [Clostridia bacterium]